MPSSTPSGRLWRGWSGSEIILVLLTAFLIGFTIYSNAGTRQDVREIPKIIAQSMPRTIQQQRTIKRATTITVGSVSEPLEMTATAAPDQDFAAFSASVEKDWAELKSSARERMRRDQEKR